MELFNILLFLTILYTTFAASKIKSHPHQGILEHYTGKPIELGKLDLNSFSLERGLPILINERKGTSGNGLVIQDMNASVLICMNKISDLLNYPKMVPFVKHVEIYENKTFQNGTTQVGAEFNVGVLGFQFTYFLLLTSHPKLQTFTWTLDYRYLSDFDDNVGHWQVMSHPTKSGWSRILYSTKLKLPHWIPFPVIHFLTSRALIDATSWLKKEAEKEQGLSPVLLATKPHPHLPPSSSSSSSSSFSSPSSSSPIHTPSIFSSFFSSFIPINRVSFFTPDTHTHSNDIKHSPESTGHHLSSSSSSSSSSLTPSHQKLPQRKRPFQLYSSPFSSSSSSSSSSSALTPRTHTLFEDIHLSSSSLWEKREKKKRIQSILSQFLDFSANKIHSKSLLLSSPSQTIRSTIRSTPLPSSSSTSSNSMLQNWKKIFSFSVINQKKSHRKEAVKGTDKGRGETDKGKDGGKKSDSQEKFTPIEEVERSCFHDSKPKLFPFYSTPSLSTYKYKK